MALNYISDEEFEVLVNEGIASIRDEFIEQLKNVAIVIADFPSREQLAKVKARPGSTLFGLYEGIPRTKRGNNYSLVLPDKITIFKVPLLCVSTDLADLRNRVKDTVWHEIAHHFGMGHEEIREHGTRKKEQTKRKE